MPARPPTIYVIAGCNGAGKTTFAKEFLPKEVKCLRFLNADEIARGLSPLKPSAGAVRAARLLLTQVDECLRRSETFALETTLSGKTYIRRFQQARKLGFEIELHFLWLSSPAQAVARVRLRVKQGGHHVPAADIRRRFKRSLVHLLDDYLPLATRWAVWDSRSLPAKRLAISSVHDIDAVSKVITNGHARKSTKTPPFVLRAERALRRAAKNVQTQSRALKLPVVVWQDGKVVEKPA